MPRARTVAVPPPIVRFVKYPLFGPPRRNLLNNANNKINIEVLTQYHDSNDNIYVAILGTSLKPYFCAYSITLFHTGHVFNVTCKRDIFEPGGPYQFCAGRDASRALALMDASEENLCSNVDDLGAIERERVQQWLSLFRCVLSRRCSRRMLKPR